MTTTCRTRIAMLLFGLALSGCIDQDLATMEASPELKVGDVDPNAPPGWPLVIGDPDIVPWGHPGGIAEMFDYWEGNCCINFVDGVPYTVKWEIETRDGVSVNVYMGHVRAVPSLGGDPLAEIEAELKRNPIPFYPGRPVEGSWVR